MDERAGLLHATARATTTTRDSDGDAIEAEGVARDVEGVARESADGTRRARARAWRARAFGATFVVLCALLGVLALVSGKGGHGTEKIDRAALGGAPRAQNAPGHIPGLAEHVESVTRSTKFRAITFCNKSYWMFAHALLESMKAVAPSIVDFWTVIVPDEATKTFIEKETAGSGHQIDVFVDDDLRKQVTKFADANKEDLKSMLSWRRVHAVQTLVDSDYTVLFLEPDAVMQKNPLQLIHDQLTTNDLVLGADYGLGTTARKHANTKVIVAKPSVQGKKLLNVWQRAEQTYTGAKAEVGFLLNEVIPHIDALTAKVQILDQTVFGNYLTHHEKAAQAIVTGLGCDNVDFKINFMTQLLRHVQPGDPNNPLSAFDYEGVAAGCDYVGREKVFKISNEFAKKKMASAMSASLGSKKTHEASDE
jgi:hypothetical protein